MTYQEFKDHLIAFLWKTGDQVLIDNLDNLITMAEHELRTSFRIADRETSDTIVTSDLETPLPAEYHSMR